MNTRVVEVSDEVRSFRPWIGTLIAASLVVSACSFEQSHGYAQSEDGSLSFRYPASWTDVDLQSAGLDWITGIDGSSQPTADNLNQPNLDGPFVVAQVLWLDPSVRDDASLRSLRLLSLNDHPDPAESDDPSVRLVFDDTFVDDNGFEGHHLRFEVDEDGGTSVQEHFAVFDPERNRVHRLWVTCSLSCFTANADAIEDVFDSVRLRP